MNSRVVVRSNGCVPLIIHFALELALLLHQGTCDSYDPKPLNAR